MATLLRNCTARHFGRTRRRNAGNGTPLHPRVFRNAETPNAVADSPRPASQNARRLRAHAPRATYGGTASPRT
eukprot:7108877-Lingulodinium_polyedra.AAC.1